MRTGQTSASASPSKRLTREARAKKQARADRAHELYVQKTYGLAPGEYAQLLEQQDGRCAICRRKPRNRRLAVDHDHNTGAVRGLLCHTCNHYVLRFIEGDPIACHSAALYIGNIARDYGPDYDPALPASGPMPVPDDRPALPRLSFRLPSRAG